MAFEEKTFQEEMLEPSLDNLLKNTKLEDGLCYINSLEITFTDKRNWGHLCHMKARGVMYKNEKIREFIYEADNIDMGVLARETKGCRYLEEGKLQFYDSVLNLEITTDIKNMNLCGKLYPELYAVKDLSLIPMDLVWIKLERMFQEKRDKNMVLEQKLLLAERERKTKDKCFYKPIERG